MERHLIDVGALVRQVLALLAAQRRPRVAHTFVLRGGVQCDEGLDGQTGSVVPNSLLTKRRHAVLRRRKRAKKRRHGAAFLFPCTVASMQLSVFMVRQLFGCLL